MRTFTKKGYGRIYVAKPEDAIKVEEIIKQMDAFEATYMPPVFIVPFTEYPNVVYTHKFSDLNLDHLTALCFEIGIYIFCFDAGSQEYPAKFKLNPVTD
jgi:hypothetical protein